MHIDDIDRHKLLYLFEQFKTNNTLKCSFERPGKRLRTFDQEFKSYYNYALSYIEQELNKDPYIKNSLLLDSIIDKCCTYSLNYQNKMKKIGKKRYIDPFDVIEMTVAAFADYVEEETVYVS